MKKLLIFGLLFMQAADYISAQNGVNTSSPTIIKTQNGVIEGSIESSGVRSFKGIPFAAPPVGNLRWKEPQPVNNWEGVRQAKQFAASGVQYNIFGDMNFRSTGMSEDCLY